MVPEQFANCIEACYACANACDYCAMTCLKGMEPHETLARCIALDLDAAQACRLTAAYLGRSSELCSYLCKFCEEICEACAIECGKFEMSHCQECAEACQYCAQQCRMHAAKIPGFQAIEGITASASVAD